MPGHRAFFALAGESVRIFPSREVASPGGGSQDITSVAKNQWPQHVFVEIQNIWLGGRYYGFG
jgi:hypothetical protein